MFLIQHFMGNLFILLCFFFHYPPKQKLQMFISNGIQHENVQFRPLFPFYAISRGWCHSGRGFDAS